MKKINASQLTKIRVSSPHDSVDTYEAYILPDAELVSGEDATDDDWNLLEEYKFYLWIADGERHVNADGKVVDLECHLVNSDSILLRCWEEPALYSGWGCHDPYAGSGINDAGEPRYEVEEEDGTVWYLV